MIHCTILLIHVACRTTRRHDNKKLLYTTAKLLAAYVSECEKECSHMILLWDLNSYVLAFTEHERLKEKKLV